MSQKKKKTYKIGQTLAIGGVVVSSLGCFMNETTTNPAPVGYNNNQVDQGVDMDMMPDYGMTLNPGPVDMDFKDMPKDLSKDLSVEDMPDDQPLDLADMSETVD